MSLPRILAVDVGASHIAGGVFEAGENRRLLLRCLAFAGFEGDPAGEDRTPERLAAFLRDFAGGEKNGTAAVMSLAGHHTLFKFARIPSLDPANEAEAISLEAARLIPGPLDEVVWDHRVFTGDGQERELMLAAAQRDAVQSHRTAAATARLRLQRLTPAALALRAGFRLNHPEATSGVIVADVGARSTNLLFLDGDRFSVRTVALGGNQITEAVAAQIPLDFSGAEALKLSVFAGRSDSSPSLPEHAAVFAAKADFVRRLGSEIVRSSLNHRRRTAAAAPEVLFLTGGGAALPDLPALLAERMKLRVERYDPLERVVVGNETAPGAEPVRASLANLIGLAAPLVAPEAGEINLVSAGRQPAFDGRMRERLALAVAAGCVAALLAPIGYFHQRAARFQEEAARVTAQAGPWRALRTLNAQQLEKIAGLRGQIDALERAVALKSSWANFLDDLQSRLGEVGDVWLDRLAILPASPGEVRVGPVPDSRSGKTPDAAAVRLSVSGRLLDVAQPLAKAGPESIAKVKRLVASVAESAFVSAVEHERFDSSQSGLLRFDFTLVLRSDHPL